MGTCDWLSEWNFRYSRVLAEVETPAATAALVDTNGDGRQLWFGLYVRSPSGEWVVALDWDDIGGHHPTERLDDLDVIFGWGTGQARQRRVIDYEGVPFPVRVGSNSWWLLVASFPQDQASTDTPDMPQDPTPGNGTSYAHGPSSRDR